MASKLIGLILICVSAFVAASLFMPEVSQQKIKAIFLTDTQKALFAECERARTVLREQKLPTAFAQVQFLVRDKRLEEDPIMQDLKKCFAVNEKSPVALEAEVFSSDFGNWASDDLQVQISVFDVKSKNKLSEVGFKLNHKNPSENERVPETLQANQAPAVPDQKSSANKQDGKNPSEPTKAIR
jgi:hypothetical protein